MPSKIATSLLGRLPFGTGSIVGVRGVDEAREMRARCTPLFPSLYPLLPRFTPFYPLLYPWYHLRSSRRPPTARSALSGQASTVHLCVKQSAAACGTCAVRPSTVRLRRPGSQAAGADAVLVRREALEDVFMAHMGMDPTQAVKDVMRELRYALSGDD